MLKGVKMNDDKTGKELFIENKVEENLKKLLK